MPYFSPAEILQIFEDLPNHQGWDPAALDAVEHQIDIQFPPIYRKLVELDANRMTAMWGCPATEGLVPPHKIIDATRRGQKIIEQEGFEFNLNPQQLVFGWDEDRPYYFDAIGSDTVPVYMPVYENMTSPAVCSPTVSDFFVALIKSYLKL